MKHTKPHLIILTGLLSLVTVTASAATVTGLTPASDSTPATLNASVTFDYGNSTYAAASPIITMVENANFKSSASWLPSGLSFDYLYKPTSLQYYSSYNGTGNSVWKGNVSGYSPIYGNIYSAYQRMGANNAGNQSHVIQKNGSGYLHYELDLNQQTGVIEVNGQAGTGLSEYYTPIFDRIPTFLWSGTYIETDEDGEHYIDYPLMNFGGSAQTLTLFKDTYGTAGIILDPVQGKITIDGLAVVTKISSDLYAFGIGTSASGQSKTVVGRYNTTTTGSDNNVVFAVGNGTSTTSSDALIIKTDASTLLSGSLVVNNEAKATTNTMTVKQSDGNNSLRVTTAGVVLVKAQGSLSMGNFGSGDQP